MKAVSCGCGGKPECTFTVRNCGGKEDKRYYYVTCKKCLALVSGETEEEAIEKWNRAMSGNRVRLHKIVLAEGEVNAPMSAPFVTGKRYRCGNCSTQLGRFWVFCPKCGTMIDWENKKGERK